MAAKSQLFKPQDRPIGGDDDALLQSILRYIRTKVRLSGNLARDLKARRQIKRRTARRAPHTRAA